MTASSSQGAIFQEDRVPSSNGNTTTVQTANTSTGTTTTTTIDQGNGYKTPGYL